MFVMIKGSTQKARTVTNMLAPDYKASKYMKQKSQ